MKIFTTDQIKDNFKEIQYVDDRLWHEIKNNEEGDMWFDDMDRDIFIKEESKLVPTSKTPLKRTLVYTKNQSILYVNYLNEIRENFESLYNVLKESNEKIYINSNNSFNCITYDKLETFLNEFSNLKNILNFHEDKNYATIKEQKLKVCLLDNKGKPRERGCMKIDNDFKIKQLFQGRSDKYEMGLESEEYVGDANWHKVPSFTNDLILQIHYIIPNNEENKSEILSKPIFAWALLIPEAILSGLSRLEKYSPKEFE